jgi:hypothetical protein
MLRFRNPSGDGACFSNALLGHYPDRSYRMAQAHGYPLGPNPRKELS